LQRWDYRPVPTVATVASVCYAEPIFELMGAVEWQLSLGKLVTSERCSAEKEGLVETTVHQIGIVVQEL